MESAQLVAGGPERVDGVDAPAGKGFYLAPTVLRADNGLEAGACHELEVFGPVSTLLGYNGSSQTAAAILAKGQGSLVSTAVSDDRIWLDNFCMGALPWVGRMMLLGSKIADSATAPGMVLPALVHGGPGRAGAGEELGGERGLSFYMQRTAVQGDQVVLKKLFVGE
jgi:oxepin-CoA hydrolase/3-oxo-5,6-dehydrosuberyl-CoA semialdehyde dehydrogenase